MTGFPPVKSVSSFSFYFKLQVHIQKQVLKMMKINFVLAFLLIGCISQIYAQDEVVAEEATPAPLEESTIAPETAAPEVVEIIERADTAGEELPSSSSESPISSSESPIDSSSEAIASSDEPVTVESTAEEPAPVEA